MKLESLSLACLSSLVSYFCVCPGAYPRGKHLEARVFVPGKLFQLSLIFVSETGVKDLSGDPHLGKLMMALPTNNRLDWDGLPRL